MPALWVAPLAGAWIEIHYLTHFNTLIYVAPLAGAWIEIQSDFQRVFRVESLPSRERGLKFDGYIIHGNRLKSLPSRERGLKYQSSFLC